jgi:hypothetical protein
MAFSTRRTQAAQVMPRTGMSMESGIKAGAGFVIVSLAIAWPPSGSG